MCPYTFHFILLLIFLSPRAFLLVCLLVLLWVTWAWAPALWDYLWFLLPLLALSSCWWVFWYLTFGIILVSCALPCVDCSFSFFRHMGVGISLALPSQSRMMELLVAIPNRPGLPLLHMGRSRICCCLRRLSLPQSPLRGIRWSWTYMPAFPLFFHLISTMMWWTCLAMRFSPLLLPSWC